MRVLLVNPPSEFANSAAEVIESIGGVVTKAADYGEAARIANSDGTDAAIITQPADPGQTATLERADFDDLMRVIEVGRIAALMVGHPAAGTRPSSRSLVEVVDHDITPPELRGRLATIKRYQHLVQGMEKELQNMESLGKRLNQHFLEVDQEMRLAARLQREFLPNIKTPIANVRFASAFRPASWVSGDMYDVFRVDEEHIGFYIADAVGHGMAAGLLTMFIKQAIVPKRISGDRYEILSPSQTMESLNDALADQALPRCQFVTAFYGLLNTTTLQLEYARGGHPYPILLTTDGSSAELKSAGGLLGLFKGQDFPTCRTHLRPGEKLVLFTDGVETVFQNDESAALDKNAYRQTLEGLADKSVDEMMLHLETTLDGESGSITPSDDVTLLGLEILDS